MLTQEIVWGSAYSHARDQCQDRRNIKKERIHGIFEKIDQGDPGPVLCGPRSWRP